MKWTLQPMPCSAISSINRPRSIRSDSSSSSSKDKKSTETTEAAAGTYFYTRGVNPRALVALAPSATLAIVIALAPGLEAMAPYSWFLGAVVSGVLYWLISDRRSSHVHCSGEHLAVESGRH